jgi:hypothetical protein
MLHQIVESVTIGRWQRVDQRLKRSNFELRFFITLKNSANVGKTFFKHFESVVVLNTKNFAVWNKLIQTSQRHQR